jgi:hypothetical protein
MGSKQRSPENSNEQIDEKGLLQPESNNHALYVMPPDACPEEQHAPKTLSRLNGQLEQSAPPAETRAARVRTVTSAFNVLHASQVATWTTSQINENKQSVPRHASLPCGPTNMSPGESAIHQRMDYGRLGLAISPQLRIAFR